MKLLKHTFLIGMAASLSMMHLACSKKQQTAQQTPPSAPAPPPTIQLKSASNLFEMSLTRLENGQENPEAANVEQVLIEAVGNTSELNAQVYFKKNSINKNYFLLPRPYSYTTSQVGNITVKKNEDGSMTIPLHISMIDGLNETISAVDGLQTIKLPPSFLVNKTKLQELTENEKISRINTLTLCPTKFLVTMDGEDFQAVTNYKGKSQLCETNRPMTIYLTLPRQKAARMINLALHESSVLLQASYSFGASIPDSHIDVKINTEVLEKSLLSRLKLTNSLSTNEQFQKESNALIRSELASVKELTPDEKSELAELLLNHFYETITDSKLIPNSPEVQKTCPVKNNCVFVKSNLAKETKQFQFKYSHRKVVGDTMSLSSFAKLQPINTPIQLLQGAHAISTKETNGREIGITVRPGDVLEFSPEAIQFYAQDITNFKTWTGEMWKECLSLGWDRKCNDERIHYQNFYQFHAPYMTRLTDPVGKVSGFYDNTFVKLAGNSNQKIRQCSFSDLRTTAVGNKFYVQMENTEKCTLFDSANDNRMLWVAHQLKYPQPLRSTEVFFQNHKDPIPDLNIVRPVYYDSPEVRLETKLSLRTFKVE
jgi:hypothetical protein